MIEESSRIDIKTLIKNNSKNILKQTITAIYHAIHAILKNPFDRDNYKIILKKEGGQDQLYSTQQIKRLLTLLGFQQFQEGFITQRQKVEQCYKHYSQFIDSYNFYFKSQFGRVNIYALKLQHGRYYIGSIRSKTKLVQDRIKQHMNQQGAEWIKLYPFVKIDKVIQNCSPFEEDRYTLEYMSKYKPQNVRGGSFCRVNRSSEELLIIQAMISTGLNRCFYCREIGHYIKDCKIKIKNNQQQIQKRLRNPLNKSSRQRIYLENKFKKPCLRCLRQDHELERCSQVQDINNQPLQVQSKEQLLVYLFQWIQMYVNFAPKIIRLIFVILLRTNLEDYFARNVKGLGIVMWVANKLPIQQGKNYALDAKSLVMQSLIAQKL